MTVAGLPVLPVGYIAIARRIADRRMILGDTGWLIYLTKGVGI
jgi:hypothetical protein